MNINVPLEDADTITFTRDEPASGPVPPVAPPASAATPYTATVTAKFYNGVLTLAFGANGWNGTASVPWADTAGIREYQFSEADFEVVKAALGKFLGTFSFKTLREYADWIVALLQAFTDLTKLQYKDA